MQNLHLSLILIYNILTNKSDQMPISLTEKWLAQSAPYHTLESNLSKKFRCSLVFLGEHCDIKNNMEIYYVDAN